MPLELHEVQSAAEFPEIMDLYYNVFEEEQSNFLPIYAPILGSGPRAREDAIQTLTTRMWFWHAVDLNSTWLKVVDTDMGDKVIAAAKWNIYKTDPFTKPQAPSMAFWWPQGEGRRYSEMVLDNIAAARLRRKPHALLHVSFAHPQHRRRGAGAMLMNWGTNKADSEGLEAFIEASPMGKLLYANHGFQVVGTGVVTPQVDEKDKSKEWKRLEQQLSPLDFTVMWRPPLQ